MEDFKIGYIAKISIDCELFTVFSEDPGSVLNDASNFSEKSPEDQMGNKPFVELIEMKRIKYIEEV